MVAMDDSIYDRLERPRRVPPRLYLALAALLIALAWLASGASGVMMAVTAATTMSLASLVR